ncbi:MAG: hypothetical protein KAU36_03405 [candidate division Zixibacteria bacterium]|nr:hypothetical protein [candidate division Zixibacteria bacterium]
MTNPCHDVCPGEDIENGFLGIIEIPKELRRFFEDYKILEHKEVIVDNLHGRIDAINSVKEALELYKKTFRDTGATA